MAFKPLERSNTFRFETPGTQLVGHYLGIKEGTFDDRPSIAHMFKTEEGRVVRAYGSDLNRQLIGKGVEGVLLQVTYKGDVKEKNKAGKSYTKKTFDIQEDRDSVIELHDEAPSTIHVEKKLA